MKNKIYKIGFLSLIGITLLALSCRKDLKDVSPQNNDAGKSITEMKFASDFNWKTTQSVALELQVKSTSSLVIKSSAGISYLKALLQPSAMYKSSITIPKYEKKLTFIVNGVATDLPITDDRIVHSF